ncbi:AAA family ATPase, partial [Candidatus Saccharibacteria bacterium]|nr:AAA family ATPase [Candidatus Saccharibacteria bacterium]
MIEFDILTLRNYLLYKEQDFVFENGITLIGGKNRTGKSLLLTSLRQIVCGTSRDDMLPTGSRVRLRSNILTPDGATRLDIQASTPTKSTKWAVKQNGIATKEHKQRTVRERIDTAFGISSSLFDSTIRLYSKNPAPLTYGQPAQRLEWLSDLFALSDTYNNLLKSAKKVKDESSDAASRLSYAKEEYKRLGSRPKPDNARISQLVAKESKLLELIKELRGKQTSSKELSELRLDLELHTAKWKTDFQSLRELQKALSSVTEKSETATRMLNEWRAYTTQQRNLRRISDEFRKVFGKELNKANI